MNPTIAMTKRHTQTEAEVHAVSAYTEGTPAKAKGRLKRGLQERPFGTWPERRDKRNGVTNGTEPLQKGCTNIKN